MKWKLAKKNSRSLHWLAMYGSTSQSEILPLAHGCLQGYVTGKKQKKWQPFYALSERATVQTQSVVPFTERQ